VESLKLTEETEESLEERCTEGMVNLRLLALKFDWYDLSEGYL